MSAADFLLQLLASAPLAVLSAAGLLIVGLMLLNLGRRSGPSLLLGLFAGIWGLQILLVRSAIVLGTPGAGEPVLLASHAFVVPLYFLMAHFAVVFPRRLRIADRAAWPALLAVPAAIAVAVLAMDARSAVDPNRTGTVWGWGTLLLLALPFLGSLLFALVRFSAGFLRAPSMPERRSMLVGILAFLVWLSYFEVTNILFYFRSLAPQIDPIAGFLYAGTFVAGLALLGGVVVALVGKAAKEDRRLVLLAGIVPGVVALLTPPAFSDTLGLWRLVFVGLLAYGVARHQLFDLDLRLRAALRPALTALAGLVVYGVLANVAREASLLPLTGAALAGVAALPVAWIWVGHALDRHFPYIRATEEYRSRRRVEVYRGAMEAGANSPQRAALARALHLTAAEVAVLEALGEQGRETAAFREGVLLVGRYRLEHPVGSGHRVWSAWDDRVQERVAVKRHAGMAGAASATREAKVLGELQHRNVIAVRDVFRVGADLCVALEHADEGSLEDLLRTHGTPLPEEALRVSAAVLAGLASAHKHGVIHRDVKPANILFRRGVVKLADFGVARDAVFEDAVRASSAQPGTLAWMSPEQARNEPVSPASDVYAVGALLYRMLAGRHYFDPSGLSEREVRNAVIRREPALPVPGTPAELSGLIAKAMAKDPGQRFPDAAAMLREVQRLQRRTRSRPGPVPQAPAATRASTSIVESTLDTDALGA